MVIVDASAAIEVARGTVRGELFKTEILEADHVLAPSIFASETANVAWKYASYGGYPRDAWLQLHKLAINEVDEFVPDIDLLPEALVEAVNNGHSVYDMLYLVLARRYAAPLLTCDSQLAKLCGQNGVKCITISELKD